MGPLSRWPIHPVLLGLYAVLFVYAANTDEVLPGQLITPLATALLISLAILLVCSLLLRSTRRGGILASAVIVAWYFFGHVSSQLADMVGSVPRLVQAMGWLTLIVLVGIYAWRARGSLPTVTAALNAFALVLVAMTLLTIVPNETSRLVRASEGEAVDDDVIATATRTPDRDIVFMMLDRYGSDWSLEHRFGIQNDITPALEERGFQVVPGARANYRATDFSLASMLSMDLLDDLTTSVGRDSGDRTPARERIGRHEVGKFLRANGYRYRHIAGWYEPTYSNPIADEVLRHGKTTELESVLRDATVQPALERIAGLVPDDVPFRIRHREEALFAFRQLERLADEPGGQDFIFAHILLPHPPYVFDAEGSHVTEAAARRRSDAENFESQLRYTNERLLDVVDRFLDRPPEEQPIIVITGDEGPFAPQCGNAACPKDTPQNLGIRYGSLRAYFLPDLDYTVPADDSGVNIFRMLFREYFGADLPDLPNRSYTWPDNDHIYDFRDITDQLPLPGAAGEPA